MDKPFPLVTKELIATLDRLYPDACPQLGTPPEKVWFDAGRASVVRKLKAEAARQGNQIAE